MNAEMVPVFFHPSQYMSQEKQYQICGDLEKGLSLYRGSIGLLPFKHSHILYRVAHLYCREQYASHRVDVSGIPFRLILVPLHIRHLSRGEITRRFENAVLKAATEHVESPSHTYAAVACFGSYDYIWIGVAFL